MVVKRKKKVIKMRGSRTHGWGLVHRNSGQRGGAGNAGTGKRAHSNKPSFWGKNYLGKQGFVKKGAVSDCNCINIKEIEDKLPIWCAEKKVVQDGNVFVVDLCKLGFEKLLSTGKATKKFKLSVNIATEKAVEKIKKAGGDVVLSAVDNSSSKEVKNKSLNPGVVVKPSTSVSVGEKSEKSLSVKMIKEDKSKKSKQA